MFEASRSASLCLLASVTVGLGCAAPLAEQETRVPAPPPPLPWAEAQRTPLPVTSPPIALVGGTVWTAVGEPIANGVVVMRDGRIVAVGDRDSVSIPRDATSIDVTGRHVTPGLIDTHSHMGVYAVPYVRAHSDGNEATGPITAQVRAADSFWPQDPALPRAVAGGVTTIQVLPGSANLIGGRGAIMKLRTGRSAADMAFVGAPATLKMACGENPKRVYGGRDSAPSTRMGNVAGYRAAYQKAMEYQRAFADWQAKHQKWHEKKHEFELSESEQGEDGNNGDAKEDKENPGPAPLPPPRDFGLETLVGVLAGNVLVQMHCYRADEMLRMLELAREFGFKIRSFHHAVEGYKIRDVLRDEDTAISTWADWWGFKVEAFDSVMENLALMTESGARGVLHSDDNMLIQRLNQEAAKAMYAGVHSGVKVSENDALRWITLNPAWVLGIDQETGSLEKGKMADVVVWSRRPFSVYALADLVFIDGQQAFDRATQTKARTTDFELGIEPAAP